MVTGNFFDVLGVRPALGRLFRPSDDEPPNAKLTEAHITRNLVLSYRAWREQFGGDSSVVGRHLIDPLVAIDYTGAILGLGVATALLKLLIAFAPPNLPRLNEVQTAGAPIGIAAALAAVAVLMFGIAPAVVTARGKIATPLRFDARTGIETKRRRAVRQLLVASQIALATVMLGGAALLARSLAQLEGQDTGFVSDHLINVWYSWNARKDTTIVSMLELADRVVRRVRAIPGVTAATPLVAPPMVGTGIWQIRFEAEGQRVTDASSNPMFPTDMIGPEFFATFGVRLVSGRAFTYDDGRTDPLVAIVSESVARRLWPGQDPIGKRIRIPGAKSEDIGGGDGWRTVVGVAHDTHLRTLREVTPMVFFPSLQGYWQGDVAIRSRLPLGALLPALRTAGREVDPDLALWSPLTMDEILDGPLAQPRLGALLMSSFGGVALLLAAIGLFGVMSSLVRDQTREFGIRIALGATPGVVRRDVLRRAGIVAGVGAAVGLAVTLLLSRLLTSLLFHVRPTDPIALGGACVVLLATAAVAAYVPAHRATTIDPVQALRAD